MAKISVLNLEGKEVSEKSLSDVFESKENPVLLAQAVNRQMNNRRSAIAHTKTRGEVSGGGRKPWKQKGTGNARAGSTRSPLWIGGGITFGPRSNRNYSERMPQKMLSAAIRMLLNQKIKNKKFIVLEDLTLPKVSTKQVYEIFSKLPIEEGKILVVLPKIDVNTELSLANIPYAKVIKAENLNVLDLMKYNFLLTSVAGLEKIEAILTGKVETDEKESK